MVCTFTNRWFSLGAYAACNPYGGSGPNYGFPSQNSYTANFIQLWVVSPEPANVPKTSLYVPGTIPPNPTWTPFYTTPKTSSSVDLGAAFTNSLFAQTMVVWRNCPSCVAPLQNVYYVRVTPIPSTLSMYSMMTFVWASANNAMNTDFKMYGSLSDAMAGTNAWLYCDFDDAGNQIGAFRDCAPTGPIGMQWYSSKTPGGAANSGATFYVLNRPEPWTQTPVNNPFFTGYPESWAQSSCLGQGYCWIGLTAQCMLPNMPQTNLGLNAIGWASSTWVPSLTVSPHVRYPSNAINNYPRLNGNICPAVDTGNGQYVHTSGGSYVTASGAAAWVTYDLGSTAAISMLQIWNRGDCCQWRLPNVAVFVSNVPGPGGGTADALGPTENGIAYNQLDTSAKACYSGTGFPNSADGNGFVTVIPCTAFGRYITIQHSTPDQYNQLWMNLCQIEIYGTPYGGCPFTAGTYFTAGSCQTAQCTNIMPGQQYAVPSAPVLADNLCPTKPCAATLTPGVYYANPGSCATTQCAATTGSWYGPPPLTRAQVCF